MFRCFLTFLLALLLCGAATSRAADTLTWAKNTRVSADIRGTELKTVLQRLSALTGWKVYLEPQTARLVSAKFSNLPPAEALHLLLGDVNFALIPEAGSRSKLLVFRTSAQNATQFVVPAKDVSATLSAKRIPNELIVRLKPGGNAKKLEASIGVKVTGQIDSLNAFRLQFENEQAADAAREQLASNSDVSSVDSNYSIERPPGPQEVASTTVPPPHLQLKPPADNGRIVIGLVDTAVQQLGGNLDSFLLKQLSVGDSAESSATSPLHGTAMAETILKALESSTKGATSVQILPVDVYGSQATTSTFDVANGITLAVNGGAKIINLSLGSDGDSPFLRDLVKEVSDKQIVLFGAKGNDPVTTPFFPAAYDGVTAVTALDQGQLASYANRAN